MLYTGKCLCGAVHYESDGPSAFMGNCYCKDCRNESGTGHITAVAVPDAGLVVTGDTASFAKRADTGQMLTKFFCPTCGSTLFTRADGLPGLAVIRAGTLDDPTVVAPQMNMYVASAPAWDKPDPAIHGFAGMATM